MVELLLLFVLVGCFLGILTGLVPGLHVNTIALLVLAFSAQGNMQAVLLIASMSIVHTFVDFVPSVVLGAPSNDTFLAVLPGHRLLLQGKGLLATRLTIIGGLSAGLMALAVAPLFVLFLEKGSEFLAGAIPFLLAAVLALMAFAEKGKRTWTLTVIALSALLGLAALHGNLPIAQPLFCLATGFFGASTLLYSIGKKQRLCRQKIGSFFIEKERAMKNAFLALLGGALVSLTPGIGSSQAAFLIRKIIGKIGTADYLILLGGVNTANMLLAFFVLFAWGKTRTGSAAAIKQLVAVEAEQLLFIAAACLFALGFAVIAADLIARAVLSRIHLIPYRKINFATLVFITLLVGFFSGLPGLAVYAVAASIGLVALNAKVRRSNCMAFLMVPTILFYLGL